MAKIDHRLVVRDGERHALLTSLTIRGGTEIHIDPGPHWLYGRWIYQTIHRSGQMNSNFVRPPGLAEMGKRGVAKRRVEPERIRGIAHLSTQYGDLRTDAWTYEPKPDSTRRATTIVDRTLLPGNHTLVHIFAVQSTRTDLVDRQLADPFAGICPNVAHALVEGPFLVLAVMYGVPAECRQEQVMNLEQDRQRERWPRGRPPNGPCPCGSGSSSTAAPICSTGSA